MKKDPLFRITLVLLAGFLFFSSLYFAKDLLVPLSFAALLSMLMLPVCRRLERWRFPRWLAILSCLIIVISIVAGLAYVFISRVISFADNLPAYKVAINSKIEHTEKFLESTTKVSPADQIVFFKEKVSGFMENSSKYIKALFIATTSTIATIAVVIIYTFFFLYFRDRFKNFILKVTDPANEVKARMVITESGKVTARYLSGVFIVIIILSVLNSVGLMLLGLDYAIMFGVMVGILNIIPYIGVPVGAIFPVTMALITKDSLWSAAGVIGVIGINQFIEANFLTPKIVGKKINLNPLATIITLLVGANLWGVPGMIIFLPFLGVLKITLDHIEPLQPYAYLIGADDSKKLPIITRIKVLGKKK